MARPRDVPALVGGNTARALEALREAAILPEEVVRELTRDYFFLRRVEHFLQIMEDRQIHVLPEEPRELEALARRVLGVGRDAGEFLTVLNDCQSRIRASYVRYLVERGEEPGER